MFFYVEDVEPCEFKEVSIRIVRDVLFVVFLDSYSLRSKLEVEEYVIDVEPVCFNTRGSSFEYSLRFKDQPNAFLREELISEIS